MDADGFEEPERDWLRQRVDGRLRPWIEWFGIGRLVGTALAVILVVVGGWWLLRTPTPPPEERLPYAAGAGGSTTTSAVVAVTTSSAQTTTTAPAVLVVHVAGAVARPGVYELAAGSRVVDAVDAAGGTTPEADPAGLNLAAPVTDGERVYVLRAGEVPPVAPAPSPRAPGGATTTATAGPVDLNRATVEELDDLPGVGPATATAIVAHREEHGPFAGVDDLEAVPGIGPAKLAAIRELVTT